MRQGQPVIGRPAWYDRNPIQRLEDYTAAAVGPHSTTQRLSWTCPSAKKAFVEVVSGVAIRTSAPTTAGLVKIKAAVQVGVASPIDIASAPFWDATVGARAEMGLAGNVTLFAADALKVYSEDGSTTGLCTYLLHYKIVEFDA